DLLANNTHRMELLEESMRMFYREWFVNLRFPGYERVKITDGIPDGWKKIEIGDLVDEVRKSIHPEDVKPHTPYVGLGHIPRKSIALTDWGCAKDVSSNKYSFEHKDILFGKIRAYFHKVVFAPFFGICSSDTIIYRPKQEDWFSLVLVMASSEHFVAFASKTAKEGAKMPRANPKVMKQYPVLLPSKYLLDEFNKIAVPIVDQIENLIVSNQKLIEARNMLLPRLINGSIPV
ncbi:unnamed protein product, partial [marine sediment metagenome]